MRSLLLAAACLLTACTPDTSIRADGGVSTVRRVDCASAVPDVTVMTQGLAFEPTPTTIAVGDVVRFVMPPQHDVSSTTSGLDVDFGATTCLEFSSAGTYSFACSAHGFMGSVIVQ